MCWCSAPGHRTRPELSTCRSISSPRKPIRVCAQTYVDRKPGIRTPGENSSVLRLLEVREKVVPGGPRRNHPHDDGIRIELIIIIVGTFGQSLSANSNVGTVNIFAVLIIWRFIVSSVRGCCCIWLHADKPWRWVWGSVGTIRYRRSYRLSLRRRIYEAVCSPPCLQIRDGASLVGEPSCLMRDKHSSII